MRDRYSEMKTKGKLCSDNRTNAKESDLILCDKGLVKQERKGKVSTMFALEPYVVKKIGNNVIFESLGGTQLMRNMTHVKKY